MTFDAPAPAVRCAAAVVDAVRALGVNVRAGVHFGETEVTRHKVSGIAVTTAARVCSAAQAGQVLVTATVADLAAGSGLEFDRAGSRELKGVPGTWEMLELQRIDGRHVEEPLDPRVAGPLRAEVSQRAARRRRLPLAAGAAAFVALVLALLVALPLLRSDDAIELGTNSVARFDAEGGALELQTSLGQRPGASVVGFGSLWVTQPDRAVVVRVDLEDGQVVDSIPVGGAPGGITADEAAVWVTDTVQGTVNRIDPDTNAISQTHRIGSAPTALTVGGGSLWVADSVGASLLRVDPDSGDWDEVRLRGQPTSVAYTSDGVWIAYAPDGAARVNPDDLSIAFESRTGSGPVAVVYGHGSVWVANHIDGTISRLDPSTGQQQAVIDVGDGPVALGLTPDGVLAAIEYDGAISRIDPARNVVTNTTPVAAAPVAMTVEADHVWLSTASSPTAHRGGTLSLVSESPRPVTLDPAVAYDPIAWQILTTTSDGLLAYKRVGGPDGVTLVPDLASSLPQVSEDGMTYRFPLRQGVTYSTGEPVRPEDFRHGLERTLVLNGEAAAFYTSIKGASACLGAPRDCDLRSSVQASPEAVTYHLERPDADLPFKLALPAAFPVPATIPATDQGVAAVPGTGPYMIGDARPRTVSLERNPAFAEWSTAAQPDGFVDRIDWGFARPAAAAFDQLDRGVDVFTDPPPSAQLVALLATHPDQVTLSATFTTFFVGLDVAKPPFDDVRIRRALSYAIDRERVVELLGGQTAQDVSCQVLPPTYQGHVPYCPYATDAADGEWSGPDTERATTLVQEARVGRTRVTVLTSNSGLPSGAVEVMRLVTETLNEIGVPARLKVLHDDADYLTTLTSPAGTDVILTCTSPGGPRTIPQPATSWSPCSPVRPRASSTRPGGAAGHWTRRWTRLSACTPPTPVHRHGRGRVSSTR